MSDDLKGFSNSPRRYCVRQNKQVISSLSRPERTTWQVSITVEDKEWIREAAAREGVTMAGWLHLMVRREQERLG